jgi:hypothetical protein
LAISGMKAAGIICSSLYNLNVFRVRFSFDGWYFAKLLVSFSLIYLHSIYLTGLLDSSLI